MDRLYQVEVFHAAVDQVNSLRSTSQCTVNLAGRYNVNVGVPFKRFLNVGDMFRGLEAQFSLDVPMRIGDNDVPARLSGGRCKSRMRTIGQQSIVQVSKILLLE